MRFLQREQDRIDVLDVQVVKDVLQRLFGGEQARQ